jgi:hypothetical protein
MSVAHRRKYGRPKRRYEKDAKEAMKLGTSRRLE